ncbi:MAG: DUF3048 domain-containing protein, partial [bacterium]
MPKITELLKLKKMKKITLITIIIAATISGALFAIKNKGEDQPQSRIISLSKDSDKKDAEEKKTENKNINQVLPVSPISGVASENGDRRPFAVMLAADESTRPISGIGQADLVVEMPVIKNGINRFMAVYITKSPEDIGSVRSARHDFIPLAQGLNAIYAHWGGSHFALDELNKKIIDDLDALPNLFDAFYRKKGVSAPDNGFTSMEKMFSASENLGYALKNDRRAENFISESEWEPESEGWVYFGENVLVNYPGKGKVEWKFDSQENKYFRFRGEKPEIDKNTGEQVSAKVVALLAVKSRVLEGQYNDVDI